MADIIPFHPKDVGADEILDAAKGEYDKVIVIGVSDGFVGYITNIEGVADVNWNIDQVKRMLFEEADGQ